MPVSPEKPQAGHLTEAKNLPQLGQALAFLATSAPQDSQKNLGAGVMGQDLSPEQPEQAGVAHCLSLT